LSVISALRNAQWVKSQQLNEPVENAQRERSMTKFTANVNHGGIVVLKESELLPEELKSVTLSATEDQRPLFQPQKKSSH
uniref:hypothetical protein n=1 Tax=Vibrio vulnificus TaxID=672 RepID=UPI001CCF1199